jgi:hypothetical protein
MSLYGGVSYFDAMNTSCSDVKDFFESKTLKQWQDNKKAEQKMYGALFERIDNVSKTVASLGKVLARR